jgi:hypothetical protein
VATRVAMARDPWNNAMPGGDQIAHALWAMASGGWVGAGPGLGDPQHLRAGYTDLVLAALGEEMGFIGVMTVVVAYAVILHRAIRASLRAASDFAFFLASGLTIALFVQLLLIAGGVFGVFPLTGVVTPFMSYGGSAMVANFCALGLLLAVSEPASSPRREAIAAFRMPLARVTVVLAALGLILVGRAFHSQVWAADPTMARPALVRLADGGFRFVDNPRLLAAARHLLERGTITDRNGIPLATNSLTALNTHAAAFSSMGVDPARACPPTQSRCYPLGGMTYHIVGDATTERDWVASNTSFVERDAAARLMGYDDHERTVDVQPPGMGTPVRITRRDYRQLIPLVRYRYNPDRTEVRELRERPRHVRLTLDARLQVKVSEILRRGVDASGSSRGAAAVVDPQTGDVLAAVSYPWPGDWADGDVTSAAEVDAGLDRVRYGLYPPGSIFKLVTAAAALDLRPQLASSRHICLTLPDGRVGNRLRGVSRPIRDDPLARIPHGMIGVDEALRVSCNAYFAQLGMQVGSAALFEMASRFDVSVASPNTVQHLRPHLPYTAFGQGETLASPIRMLGVTSAIANGGRLVPARWLLEPAPAAAAEVVLSRPAAARIARAMATAVTGGTGRILSGVRPAIAGKTGTAEATGGASHAWFTGFAPYGAPGRRLAFLVLVERGGYGSRAAAPIAGQIVEAARELRLFEEGRSQ